MIFIVALVLCPVSFSMQYMLLSKRNTEIVNGLERWKASGEGLKHPDQARAAASLRKAMEKGYYSLPDS